MGKNLNVKLTKTACANCSDVKPCTECVKRGLNCEDPPLLVGRKKRNVLTLNSSSSTTFELDGISSNSLNGDGNIIESENTHSGPKLRKKFIATPDQVMEDEMYEEENVSPDETEDTEYDAQSAEANNNNEEPPAAVKSYHANFVKYSAAIAKSKKNKQKDVLSREKVDLKKQKKSKKKSKKTKQSKNNSITNYIPPIEATAPLITTPPPPEIAVETAPPQPEELTEEQIVEKESKKLIEVMHKADSSIDFLKTSRFQQDYDYLLESGINMFAKLKEILGDVQKNVKSKETS